MNTPAANKKRLREIRDREAGIGHKARGADPDKKPPKGNRTFKAGHNRYFIGDKK